MKDFALGLGLKQRQKRTRKWPIETTISCIDHIHSNFVSPSTSGSIAVEIADHLPVFCLSYDPTLNPFPDTIEIRDLKMFDKCAFRDTF